MMGMMMMMMTVAAVRSNIGRRCNGGGSVVFEVRAHISCVFSFTLMLASSTFAISWDLQRFDLDILNDFDSSKLRSMDFEESE